MSFIFCRSFGEVSKNCDPFSSFGYAETTPLYDHPHLTNGRYCSVVQVYILDKDYAWRPAILDDTKGDKAFVTVPEYPDEQSMMSDGGRSAKKGSQVTLDLKQYPHKVLPLQNVDAQGNLTMFPDMVKLPYLHEVRIF